MNSVISSKRIINDWNDSHQSIHRSSMIWRHFRCLPMNSDRFRCYWLHRCMHSPTNGSWSLSLCHGPDHLCRISSWPLLVSIFHPNACRSLDLNETEIWFIQLGYWRPSAPKFYFTPSNGKCVVVIVVVYLLSSHISTKYSLRNPCGGWQFIYLLFPMKFADDETRVTKKTHMFHWQTPGWTVNATEWSCTQTDRLCIDVARSTSVTLSFHLLLQSIFVVIFNLRRRKFFRISFQSKKR